MTLQQLHYVLVIAEAGSLNRAAEQLYLSQPSLTSAVRELEKELGIVLFNRSDAGRRGIPALCPSALPSIRKPDG